MKIIISDGPYSFFFIVGLNKFMADFSYEILLFIQNKY